jgi:hypothetical protein
MDYSYQDRIDLALWAAWHELNEIRARDGVPYTHQGHKASVDETYFSRLTDELAHILGSDAKPWPPKRCCLPDGSFEFGIQIIEREKAEELAARP